MRTRRQPNRHTVGVHPDVLKLGFVSLLTDISSEMIFSVFAIFFTRIAGASSALLGLVEGLADFAASSLDYLAGWSSDRSGKRKPLALVGYCLSVVAKTILLIATSVAALSVFRVTERLGKSFRSPPRDAWLAAISSKEARGYSFGIHKALDKTGAVIGPLVAYWLLEKLGETRGAFRVLFWVAFVPAVLAVVLLALVKDRPGAPHKRENMFVAWRTLSAGFKRYLAAAGVFSLAYFSFSFLLLRANSIGFSAMDVVLLYALFNAAFVATAPLVGRLGDHIGRTHIVAISYLLYFAMSIGFVFATRPWQLIALFIVYGIFYSMDEAQTKAFIADIEPERRATAMGAYNFLTGVIYLPASLIAGALWTVNPNLVFIVAALLALAGLAVFVVLRPAHH